MTEALDQREEDQKLEKNNLFVGNLDGRIRRRHLKEFFSQFGEVVFTKVAFNKETRRSR
ncbi:RNA-binding protein [bacterium]|nr:RNA-binding protein [bacterium]